MKKLLAIFVLISLIGISYADTNGVWHNPKDVRGGVFGSDELDVTSFYSFINPVLINNTLTVSGYVSLFEPTNSSHGATKNYVDTRFNLAYNNILDCNELGMLYNGSECVFATGTDTSPDEVDFEDITGAEFNTFYESNEITVSGFSGYLNVEVKNNDTPVRLYVNGVNVGTQAQVSVGDRVKVSLYSLDDYELTSSTAVIIGSFATSFSVKTKAQIDYTFTAGTYYSINVADLLGNPTEVRQYTIVIDPGAKIGSNSYTTPAISTAGLPSGSTFYLINNGKVQGAGGRGSTQTGYCGNGGSGQPGGDAIYTTLDITIENQYGEIWGGGGGGGTGGGSISGKNYVGCGRGGGGAGIVGGSSTGNSGTEYAGGNGITTCDDASDGGGGCSYGGSGGAPGQAGQAGSGSNNNGRSNGAGGSAGKAIELNGNSVDWVDYQGDIKGSIS